MAQTRITISLSPELIGQLDQKRQQMGTPPPSRAKAVVMLLQEQLGGQDQGFKLIIEQAAQSDAVPGKVVDFETFSIKIPDDVDWRER